MHFLEEVTFAYVAGAWKLWAQERQVKGEEAPTRKAHENHFNSHSVSADRYVQLVERLPKEKVTALGKKTVSQ